MKVITSLMMVCLIVIAAGCSKNDSPTSSNAVQGSSPRIYVNPANGSDDNTGTDTAPLKTIKKALALAQSGQRVDLQAGTYDIASGQTYPDTIPNGVTVEAVSAGLAVLLGNAGATAFVGAGNDTLRYLSVQGFNTLMTATTGNHVMISTTVTNVQTCYYLTGSTQGIINNCTFASSAVASLTDLAQVTLNSSTVSGNATNELVILQKASSFVMNNSTMKDCQTTGIDMREISQATVVGSTIANVSYHGSGSSSSIDMSGTSHLFMRSSYIYGAYSQALYSRNAGTVMTLRASNFGGNGIVLYGGACDVDSCTFSSGTLGIWFSNGSIAASSLSIRNSTVQYYTNTGILALSQNYSLSARNTVFTSCQTGMYLGESPTIADLGTAASPGGNTFTGNTQWGLRIGVPSGFIVNAAGNTWTPSLGGANASGKYAAALITGVTSSTTPLNYYIDTNGAKIQF